MLWFMIAAQSIRMVIFKSLMAMIGYLTSARIASAHIAVYTVIPLGAILNTLTMHRTAVSILLWLTNQQV